MSVILELIPGRARDLGGFSVRRVLPIGHRKLVGPFIFFDHMGPMALPAGEGMDVRPHPHIGLATVTYLFEGRILHRDSLGSVQPIEPGAVNWMTAGRGIVHSERSTPEDRAAGVRMHGIQSWVALPADMEEADPAFVHHAADTLPRLARDGFELTLIAGTGWGLRSPVVVMSPTLYADVRLQPGARLQIPDEHEERAVYPVDGDIRIDGEPVEAGTMAVLEPGAQPYVESETPVRLMIVGGARMQPERLVWWNFVSSRPERIEQAKRDWLAQRFDAVPGENEFIPLPER